MSDHSSSCPDCGNAPTNHMVAKVNAFFSRVGEVLTSHGRPKESNVVPFVESLLAPFVPNMLSFLEILGVGKTIRTFEPSMGTRIQALWEEAIRRGIMFSTFRFGKHGKVLGVASYGRKTVVFDGLPRPKRKTPHGFFWMDDKGKIRDVFPSNGIPMAKGAIVRTWNEAQKLFLTLRAPVITKPHWGSRSRHTTTHIDTIEELRMAFDKAKMLSPWIILEEELSGLVHRATVIGSKVVGILRREPAAVTGDGIHTVEELVTTENRNPLRKGPIFHTIEIHDHEHAKELERQGLTFESIPEQGLLITLLQKASRGLGGGATDMTDVAHPDNIALFEHVAAVLDDPVVGIDFIISDMTRSWKEQPRSGIIECNSVPFIDLHVYPLHGKPRNTPGALWELIFPGSG